MQATELDPRGDRFAKALVVGFALTPIQLLDPTVLRDRQSARAGALGDEVLLVSRIDEESREFADFRLLVPMP